jgi:clan AA aspartic protease (TIGR02281 family)
MRNHYMVFLILIITPLISFSQCISGDCENGVGIYVTKEKDRMEGTWKNGKLEGKSKIAYKSGELYEGNMIQGVKNGVGKYIYSNGDYYEGSWKNSKQNGAGKYVAKSGYSAEGKYVNDTLDGYATIKFSEQEKYIGYVQNSLFEGKGIYFFPNGDKFEGNWSASKKNGAGTYYYQKGGTLKGIWKDNVYISGSSITNKADSLKVINPVLSNSGIYEVNVSLNNVLKIDMVFDTGASEVYFTPDVVLTLFKTKTITEDDLLEGAMFMDANGNVNKSARFNLKSMQIGNIKLVNIPCAVSSNVNGANLLGLSALRKLGKFEFDFNQAIIKVN